MFNIIRNITASDYFNNQFPNSPSVDSNVFTKKWEAVETQGSSVISNDSFQQSINTSGTNGVSYKNKAVLSGEFSIRVIATITNIVDDNTLIQRALVSFFNSNNKRVEFQYGKDYANDNSKYSVSLYDDPQGEVPPYSPYTIMGNQFLTSNKLWIHITRNSSNLIGMSWSQNGVNYEVPFGFEPVYSEDLYFQLGTLTNSAQFSVKWEDLSVLDGNGEPIVITTVSNPLKINNKILNL